MLYKQDATQKARGEFHGGKTGEVAMSLVNKMLRDLDARRASEAERGALPSAVTPLAARREIASPWPKRMAILLVLITGAILAAWQWRKNPPTPVVNPAPHNEAVAVPVTAVTNKLPAPQPPTATVLAEAAPTKGGQPVTVVQSATRKVEPTQNPPATTTKPSLTSSDPQQAARATPAAEGVKASPALATSLLLPPIQNTSNPKTTGTPRIEKQEHLPSPTERAETIYQSGREVQRAGRPEDAIAQYQAALALAPEHAASRQALVGLLIDNQRWDAAEKVLREGVDLPTTRLASTLTLARLFVERSKIPAALDLMQQQAASGEKNAEYQGFLAVLLNRAGRPHEAVERYQAATRLAPSEARWWAGLGIALEADGQNAAAHDAYLKARSLPGLPPELATHVEQKLR
jgi:MSHA biogenesis protein MshN